MEVWVGQRKDEAEALAYVEEERGGVRQCSVLWNVQGCRVAGKLNGCG